MVDTGSLKLDVLSKIEVDKVGVVRLEDWKGTPLSDKAKGLLPGARSVIVMALELFGEVVDCATSHMQMGDMAMRSTFTVYNDFISGRLNVAGYRTVKELHNHGYKGLPMPAGGGIRDDRFLVGPLSFKHAAQAAGLGIIGRHTLLLTPEFGPRVRLSCVITDAPLSPTLPLRGERPCVECGGACAKICPAGAIGEPEKGEPYKFNRFACFTHNRATGLCSECMKVCTAGRKAWYMER